MKMLKRVLYVDIIVQAVCIFSFTCAILAALTGFQSQYTFAGVLGLILLGIWQPLSGFIIGFWQKDSWRKKYLLGVLIWGVCVGFLNQESFYRTSLEEPFSSIYYIVCSFLGLFPLGFALAYFRHSYIHLVKLLATPRSFWELE